VGQPKTRVRPVRISIPDADVTATVLRGVGYRARCDCGWQSRRCKSWRDARQASRIHNATHG